MARRSSTKRAFDSCRRERLILSRKTPAIAGQVDALAGVVVGVIALPLSMALAIAAGAAAGMMLGSHHWSFNAALLLGAGVIAQRGTAA